MRYTGITREVDSLGRIVLPKELRRSFEIKEKDALEIYVENDYIILRKQRSSCIFCGNEDHLIDYKGKKVCRTCLSQLAR